MWPIPKVGVTHACCFVLGNKGCHDVEYSCMELDFHSESLSLPQYQLVAQVMNIGIGHCSAGWLPSVMCEPFASVT